MTGFKTKEEAIEAWNTWKGHYETPSPELFRECNPCNSCAYLVKGNKYNEPEIEEMVAPSLMLPNGVFTSPWPLLSQVQVNALKEKEFDDYKIEDAFAFRARWCSLFPSITKYREEVTQVLKKNDRENVLLNQNLTIWNKRLAELGFPLFETNDLRGVNLGGLDLSGKSYDGVWLRNVDLRFSELSLAQLNGANLYNADLRGSVARYGSFMYVIASKTNFSHSFLIQSRFELSDLNEANFNFSQCYQSQFNGSILCNASVCGTNLKNTSFKSVELNDKGIRKNKKTNLTGLNWDSETQLEDSDLLISGALFDDELKSFLSLDNVEKKKIFTRLYDSVQLKPSMFGLGIDIKELFEKKS